MKTVTSITLHTTSEGQRMSYTYSEIDENTGAIISDNNRESVILLDIPRNKEVLGHIEGIKAHLNSTLEG